MLESLFYGASHHGIKKKSFLYSIYTQEHNDEPKLPSLLFFVCIFFFVVLYPALYQVCGQTFLRFFKSPKYNLLSLSLFCVIFLSGFLKVLSINCSTKVLRELQNVEERLFHGCFCSILLVLLTLGRCCPACRESFRKKLLLDKNEIT